MFKNNRFRFIRHLYEDNVMLRLSKNISVFKNIKHINLKETQLTIESQKYLDQMKKLNIKITLSKLETRYQKISYKIFLWGSDFSGKRTYINIYKKKNFCENNILFMEEVFFIINTPEVLRE